MKKFMYYSPYVPLIGIPLAAFHTLTGNATCIERTGHKVISAVVQIVSIVLFFNTIT